MFGHHEAVLTPLSSTGPLTWCVGVVSINLVQRNRREEGGVGGLSVDVLVVGGP